MIRTASSGAVPALLSALLFGASTPLAKLLLKDVDPWMLAGLLYLGSGLGLLAVRTLVLGPGTGRGAAIRGAGWLWLALAILSGGVAGPVLLLFGLAHTAATTASLLLNLEGVMTALLAWFVFRENFDRRIALGMAAIVAGGLVLTWGGSLAPDALPGPLMIAGACLAWAVDNNLTRKVSLADPVQIAMLKGGVAGVDGADRCVFLAGPFLRRARRGPGPQGAGDGPDRCRRLPHGSRRVASSHGAPRTRAQSRGDGPRASARA